MTTINCGATDDSTVRGKYKIGYYPEGNRRKKKNKRIDVEFVGSKREVVKVEYYPKRYSMVQK